MVNWSLCSPDVKLTRDSNVKLQIFQQKWMSDVLMIDAATAAAATTATAAVSTTVAWIPIA